MFFLFFAKACFLSSFSFSVLTLISPRYIVSLHISLIIFISSLRFHFSSAIFFSSISRHEHFLRR